MIVYIFFQPGDGGDGLANLLEQSNNAVTIDGLKKWRIHRYVDSIPKFWAPNLQNSKDRINTVDMLDEILLEAACSKNHYLIVTSHSSTSVGDHPGIPKDCIVTVGLTCKDPRQTWMNYLHKNLVEYSIPLLVPKLVPKFLFDSSTQINNKDFTLDIDQLQASWEYTKNFVQHIGLMLEKTDFDHYINLISGKIQDRAPGIEHYQSWVDPSNIRKYTKVN